MKKLVHLGILALGAALVALGIWLGPNGSVLPEDQTAIFAQLASVSMQTVDKLEAIDLTVRLPDNAMWNRIRKAWGDPGYIITGINPRGTTLLCFDDLHLTIEARIGTKSIPLKRAEDPPYGFSAECTSYGLSFRASPGAELRLHVTAKRDPKRSDGSLIVKGYWASDVKDRLVGVSLRQEFKTPARIVSVCGISLLVIELILLLFKAIRPSH